MNDKIVPFSNGFEVMSFEEDNCHGCKIYENTETELYGEKCPFFMDIMMAYMGDGKISKKIYDEYIKNNSCIKRDQS